MNSPRLWLALQDTEKEFLRQGRVLTGQLQALQTRMAQMTLDEELHALGWSRSSSSSTYDSDEDDDDDDEDEEDLSTLSSWLLPNTVTNNNNSSNTASNAGSNLTSTSGSAAMMLPPAKSWLPGRFGGKDNKKRKLVGAGGTASSSAAIQDLWKQIHSIQEELQQLEWQFVQDVMRLVGPQQALAVRTALLGDVAVRGSGSLLHSVDEFDSKHAVSLAMAAAALLFPVPHLNWSFKILFASIEYFTVISMTGRLPSNYCP